MQEREPASSLIQFVVSRPPKNLRQLERDVQTLEQCIAVKSPKKNYGLLKGKAQRASKESNKVLSVQLQEQQRIMNELLIKKSLSVAERTGKKKSRSAESEILQKKMEEYDGEIQNKLLYQILMWDEKKKKNKQKTI